MAWSKPAVICPSCKRQVKADVMWGVYQDDRMRRPVRHRRQLVTGQLGDWCEPRSVWRQEPPGSETLGRRVTIPEGR
jgi:hypothetical protein